MLPATEGTWRDFSWVDAARRKTIAYGLLASVVLLLVLGSFLVARRAIGAMTTPLPPRMLVTTVLALLAWTWAFRMLGFRLGQLMPSRPPGAEQRLIFWLPSAVILLFAVACSFPGGRIVDWLVWLPAIIAVSAPRMPLVLSTLVPVPGSSPTVVINHESEQLLQQLTRSRAADGSHVVRGTLTAEFAAGERIATLHVAFCPPFERLPHVAANAADESLASVKVVQVLHNGVQLEVRRLTEPAEAAAAVSVELLATGS